MIIISNLCNNKKDPDETKLSLGTMLFILRETQIYTSELLKNKTASQFTIFYWDSLTTKHNFSNGYVT